jgi:hypothetical protein
LSRVKLHWGLASLMWLFGDTMLVLLCYKRLTQQKGQQGSC